MATAQTTNFVCLRTSFPRTPATSTNNGILEIKFYNSLLPVAVRNIAINLFYCIAPQTLSSLEGALFAPKKAEKN
jgi:hypothetical protein